jgi:hypothetical protein
MPRCRFDRRRNIWQVNKALALMPHDPGSARLAAEKARGEFAKAIKGAERGTPHVFLARIARDQSDLATARAKTPYRGSSQNAIAGDGIRARYDPRAGSSPGGAGQSTGLCGAGLSGCAVRLIAQEGNELHLKPVLVHGPPVAAGNYNPPPPL